MTISESIYIVLLSSVVLQPSGIKVPVTVRRRAYRAYRQGRNFFVPDLRLINQINFQKLTLVNNGKNVRTFSRNLYFTWMQKNLSLKKKIKKIWNRVGWRNDFTDGQKMFRFNFCRKRRSSRTIPNNYLENGNFTHIQLSVFDFNSLEKIERMFKLVIFDLRHICLTLAL